MSETLASAARAQSPRKHIFVALRILVSVGLIALLLSRVDLRRLFDLWRGLSPSLLLLAIGLQFIGILISAAKWWVLLRAQGERISYGWTVRVYLIGTFFSNFLPTMIGGDAVRIILLRGRIGNGSLALASVFVERLTGFIALTTIGWIAFGLSRDALGTAPALLSGLLWCLLVATAAVLAACSAPLLVRALVALRLPNLLNWRGRMQTIADQIRSFAGYPAPLALAMILAFAYQFSWIAVNGASAHALHLDIAWRYVALMVPISDIIALVPVFLNGLGAREATYVLLLDQLAGTPAAAAIALSFLIFVVRLVVSSIGGLVYLLGGTRVPKTAPPERVAVEEV